MHKFITEVHRGLSTVPVPRLHDCLVWLRHVRVSVKYFFRTAMYTGGIHTYTHTHMRKFVRQRVHWCILSVSSNHVQSVSRVSPLDPNRFGISVHSLRKLRDFHLIELTRTPVYCRCVRRRQANYKAVGETAKHTRGLSYSKISG